MLEPVGLQPVANVAPVLVALDEAGGAQRVEMLGDRLAADRKLRRQLGRGERPVPADQRQHLRRVGSASASKTASASFHTRRRA